MVLLLTAGLSAQLASAASTIYIASSQANATTAGMMGTDSSINASGPSLFQASGAATDSLLLVSTLQTALANGNVSVSAANASASGLGKIVIVDGFTWTTANPLGLNAPNCVEANAAVVATAAAAISVQVGPSTASVSCGGLTEAGIYVFGMLSSNGGNLAFSSSGGIPGNGQSIWFGSTSTISTVGNGNITVHTDQAATAAHWLGTGKVNVVDGRISVDVGGRVDIGGYSGADVSATGSNATPVANGGQIDIRARSGNISLLAGQAASRVNSANGAVRINAANALLLRGGVGSDAEALLAPTGDLRIDAKALHASAGSASGTDADVRYSGTGANIAIVLSGNPVGLIPASATLYLLGGSSSGAFSADASIIQNYLFSDPASVVVSVAVGDAVMKGGTAAGYAQMNFHGATSNVFTLLDGNLLMQGGGGDSSDAIMGSTGSRFDLTVHGSATLQASDVGRSAAFIGTDPGLNLQILGPNGNLSLLGGLVPSLKAGSPAAGISTQNGAASIQQITVEQTLLMRGGIVEGSEAFLTGPTQVISVGRLQMEDGTGGQTYIRNAAGNQDYPQTITVRDGATIGTTSGAAAASTIRHGGSTPQTIVIGGALKVNGSGLISTPNFGTSVTTLVVDNQNATRPQHDESHTLINLGTLDIRPLSQIHAVNPASTSLGSYVPAASRFDHWYGESAAVNGVNYKSQSDGGFTPPQLLTVTTSGNGTGSVSSSPSGINCGVTCSATFPGNAMVTLTAAPGAGSQFAGWSGACTGNASCVVTMDAAKTVNAAFTLTPPVLVPLTVVTSGAGTGVVASTPAGIQCGSTCSASFAANSVVTLTPTPAAGSVFSGWGGACNGSAGCVVTMDTAKTVTASFALAPPPIVLSVSRSGTGSGNVSSNPVGIINCGSVCSSTAFAPGASIVLTATPTAGSSFSGWNGACSNSSGPCIVTMSQSLAVDAAFTALPAAVMLPVPTLDDVALLLLGLLLIVVAARAVHARRPYDSNTE